MRQHPWSNLFQGPDELSGPSFLPYAFPFKNQAIPNARPARSALEAPRGRSPRGAVRAVRLSRASPFPEGWLRLRLQDALNGPRIGPRACSQSPGHAGVKAPQQPGNPGPARRPGTAGREWGARHSPPTPTRPPSWPFTPGPDHPVHAPDSRSGPAQTRLPSILPARRLAGPS